MNIDYIVAIHYYCSLQNNIPRAHRDVPRHAYFCEEICLSPSCHNPISKSASKVRGGNLTSVSSYLTSLSVGAQKATWLSLDFVKYNVSARAGMGHVGGKATRETISQEKVLSIRVL